MLSPAKPRADFLWTRRGWPATLRASFHLEQADAFARSRRAARREAMQFNVFEWIREGVKRSVILGVSDAMESIGSPDGEDARARLAQLLPATAEAAAEPALAGGKRKRLGRS